MPARSTKNALFSVLIAPFLALSTAPTVVVAGPALESPMGNVAYSENIGPEAVTVAVFGELKAKFEAAEVDLEVQVPTILDGRALWDDDRFARELDSMTSGGSMRRGVSLDAGQFLTDEVLDSSAFGVHIATRLAGVLGEPSPPNPEDYPDGTAVEAAAEACPLGAQRVIVTRLTNVTGLAPGWYVTERTWSPLDCPEATD